ncbi:MAG: histidine phosphatase family protein [Spirochaetales bacterium]|nr:histidine phosphatase family protein [Spirochaetales bacterium]
MKQVILVRHALAVEREEGLPDFVRSLQKKGRRQAEKMSKKLRKREIPVPDLFISSPANRALETAQVYAKEFGYPVKKIMLKDELYNDISSQSFLDMIKSLDNKTGSVIVFGHDPSITGFAHVLAKGFTEKLPKCATLVVTFNINEWKKCANGTGKVSFFEYPKRLARYYRARTKEVAEKLEERIADLLKSYDTDVAIKKTPSIRMWAYEIARGFIKSVRKAGAKKNKSAQHEKPGPKEETRIDIAASENPVQRKD